MIQIPVLSTAHLTKATNDLLHAGPSAWHLHWFHHCAGYDFGWFLSVPTEEFQQANDAAPPADILAVMMWARKHGLGWIRLDSDGSATNELPTCDWKSSTSTQRHPPSDVWRFSFALSVLAQAPATQSGFPGP